MCGEKNLGDDNWSDGLVFCIRRRGNKCIDQLKIFIHSADSSVLGAVDLCCHFFKTVMKSASAGVIVGKIKAALSLESGEPTKNRVSGAGRH